MTLDAAVGFVKLTPDAAKTWTERLSTLEETMIFELFENVPIDRMSRITREFSIALVIENRRRILETLTP